MTALVTGGCKSGKSSFAQRLACALSPAAPRYYLATMIPADSEDRERVRLHVREREGLGFATVEQGRRILESLGRIDMAGTVLLDSLTALLANEMFCGGDCDPAAGGRVAGELAAFAAGMGGGNAVFVSDGIYCDSRRYDGLTEGYRRALACCERELAAGCDVVVELCAGLPLVRKGAGLWQALEVAGTIIWKKNDKKEDAMELVIGGACQGKLAYAREKYALRDEDICVCTEDAAPDFSRRCLAHIENYVAFCLRTGGEPALSFAPSAVLICDDIFCGVVPVDAFERRWRERAGRYVQELARAAHVTRVSCGIAEALS